MGDYRNDKNSFGLIFTLLMFWQGNQGHLSTCVVFIHEIQVLKSKNYKYILANIVASGSQFS